MNHQGILLTTMALGLVASFFLDRGRVRDEREELIRLKSYTVSHWATLCVLLGFASANLVQPAAGIEAYPLLWGVLIAALYGEIGAKIYFRWRL